MGYEKKTPTRDEMLKTVGGKTGSNKPEQAKEICPCGSVGGKESTGKKGGKY